MKDFIFIIILIVLLILGYFLTGGFGKFMDKINPLREKAERLRHKIRRDKFNRTKP